MNTKQVEAHENHLKCQEAAGEIIRRKQQERSNACTTKPKGKGKKALHHANRGDDKDKENVEEDKDSSDEEGNNEGKSSDEEMSARKRQWVTGQRDGSFRSRSIIDDADDV